MGRIRYLVLVLMVTSSVVVYINRTNLNIAIVPMTAKTTLPNSSSSGPEVRYGCPLPEKNLLTTNLSAIVNHEPVLAPEKVMLTGKSYDWDQTTQGKILGSFFWSYFIFMVPAGILAEKFGARSMFFATLAGPALVSILIPFITDYHYSILIFTRFILGIFQSGFYPAAYGMATRWFPLHERSLAFAMIDIGAVLGSVITYLTAGPIIDFWGWPCLFYIPGLISFLMCFIACAGLRSQPHHHPLVSERELKKIRSGEPSQAETCTKVRRPSPNWAQVLTCPAVLATALFKFSTTLCMSLIYMELPKYLSEVIHENIIDNGSINALLFIVAIISMTMNGWLSEHIIQKKWLSRTATRKAFSVFSGTIGPVCLIMIPIVGCDTSALRLLLCLNAFFNGFCSGSDGPIVSEMTHNFPAILYAMFNMIAMSTGFIVPYCVGLVLDEFQDPTAGWPIVFYSCAGLSMFANLIYVSFAQAERQKFDMISSDEEQQVFKRTEDYGASRAISPIM